MDPPGLIYMAMKVALEAQIEETRQMEESLRADFEAYVDKAKELSMLKTKNQNMLAEEAPKAKFVDDFMFFLEAIDNGDLEIAKGFDEKAMMDTLLTMVDGGADGGLAGLYGDDLHIIGLGLEEKDTADSIATVKTDGSCGGDKAGFSGDFDQEGSMVAVTEGPNSDGVGA